MTKTPLRAIRIDTALWEAAQRKAKAEGRDVSAVIREYLSSWVTRPPRRSK
ncbi:ribbon-helix-helix protein, CopG family [Mycolicibacterium porcinum]|uniref:ribbon-helix-helix protein, CopG family n=1 Tax=Mycolicibacterium porcinum TaxID=39693 RepID=UPI000F09DF23